MMGRDAARLQLFPGMSDVLKALSDAGVRLAILSSNASKNIHTVLGPEMQSLFHYYQCGVTFSGKESKRNRLLKKTRAKPHETMFIGDELRDLEAAQAAAVHFGAASWGLNSKETFEKYDLFLVFERPEDISHQILSD